VTDSGNPNQSAWKTFSIVVVDLTLDIPVLGTNGLSLTWSALAGLSYQLQYKNSLNDPLWLVAPGDGVVTNGVASIHDPQAVTNSSRFYRLIALP
jgi:hypothetical protein